MCKIVNSAPKEKEICKNANLINTGYCSVATLKFTSRNSLFQVQPNCRISKILTENKTI